MNSRFDQAVEQILKEYVVEEGILGSIGSGLKNMVKQPWDAVKSAGKRIAQAPGNAAQKFADNPWGTIGSAAKGGWNVAKGVGRLVSPIASTALGFTPSGLRTGVGAVMDVPKGIKNVYQGKNWSDQGSNTSSNSKNTNKSPIPFNNLNVSSSDAANVTKQLAPTAAEQAAMRPKLQSMFPMRGYVSAAPASQMWVAVSEAAKKTQPGTHYKDIVSNPSLKSVFVTKFQQELRTAGVDNRDITKLVASVPDFLATISSSVNNDTVDTAILNLL